mgnify:CR=1 FL=1|jgi:AmmeMemoRadiSam system radical SAM enzyme
MSNKKSDDKFDQFKSPPCAISPSVQDNELFLATHQELNKQEEEKPHFGKWYHEIEDGKRVQCDLCPRYCKIRDGQRGFCFVRKNIGNKMALTTYGKSSGFCVDPIEKKPLNHYYPGQSIFSFGTAGCNLGCKFCQNWDISKSREIDSLTQKASPMELAQAAKRLGCIGVAFTYNDPVIFAEYAIDIAHACHEIGLKTVAVTAGYITSEAREDFFSVMDATNVDLKGFTTQFYKKICFANLGPILDTLKYLKDETDVWFEITNLIIPDTNDSNTEIQAMVDWILAELGPDIPVHFTAFHPDFKMMDLPPTPPETLIRAREIALKSGLKYAYTGNIHNPEGDSTYCPKCNELLINRDWYNLGVYNIKNNKCRFCGEKISGTLPDHKGDWGRKRLSVTDIDKK